MKPLALAILFLTAPIGFFAAQGAPKQGVTELERSLNPKKTKQPGQNHEAADKVVSPRADQPSAHISDTETARSSEDIEIQRKLVKFTKWLAIVGALQFLALISQAIVFWFTLKRMRDTANRELRAYISVSSARVKFYSPVLPEAQVHLQNCGKTPAYQLRYQIHLWIGPYPLPTGTILPPPSEVVMNATAVVGPNQGITLNHLKDASVGIPALPLGTPASTLYIYGVVNYRDAFGEEKYTKFRFTWGNRTFTENGEQFGVPNTDPEGNEAN
jgi:hypothetical protein